MKKFTIKSTEVFDHEIKYDEETYNLGGVEVNVEVIIDNNIFFLVFQTSITHDDGAISSILKAYDGDEGYLLLQEYIDDYAEFDDLLEAIKIESKAQEGWDEYIEENYIRNESHFGGLDANSEHCEAKRKTKTYT